MIFININQRKVETVQTRENKEFIIIIIIIINFTESSTCLKQDHRKFSHLGFQDLELPVIHLCLQVSTSCQPYWFLHFILFSLF